MPEGNKESMTAKTRLAMSLPGQPQRATLSNLLRHLHAPFAAFYETVSDRHIMSDGNSTPSTAAMLMKGRPSEVVIENRLRFFASMMRRSTDCLVLVVMRTSNSNWKRLPPYRSKKLWTKE
ncbi:hypothetical protein RB195_001289 [Necator americanus]|uniref:Uncharacterized protein n=1 Tax=Necator americanus TaxID=51031 RepID=A0ABR1DDM3_NECAM